MSVRLENWSVRSSNAYLAPENNPTYLCGEAYGHPRYENGAKIRTSIIVDVSGRQVITISGTVYELGEIRPEYRQWLDDNGFAYDPDNPIAVGLGNAKRKVS